MEVKRVAEEWEIWDEEEEVARSEEEAKKLVPKEFHRWIKIFSKKQSERMPMKKIWDHAIETKEGFVPRKGKVYPLSREERKEVREFVQEQVKEGVYPTIQITIDGTGIFCRKKVWEEADGTRLLIFE